MTDKDVIGQCGICHLSILYVDDYVVVKDFIKGQEKGEFKYHRQCFRDKLNVNPKKLETYALNLLQRADKNMTGLGI
jgi:hypothetical protein